MTAVTFRDVSKFASVYVNTAIIANNEYVETFSFTSIGLKVHGINNLKFVILSCGYC